VGMDLTQRYKYLGGTDCAAVLGLSRWRTPLQVWAEKTEQIIPKELDSEAAELGKELEDYVARRFCKKTGKEVRRINETLFHKKYNFLGANIDRRIVGENTILECKTCSAWKSKEWEGEEIPAEYIMQCYHYIMVTGVEKCYIAVLIGNQDFKWKEIKRDEKIISEILKKEVAFWNNFIKTKEMPMIITKNDDDVLYQLFPNAETEKVIELPDDADKIVDSVKLLTADKINLEGLIEQQKNELKAMLKEAEIGLTKKYKIKWSNIISNRLETKKFKAEQLEMYNKYVKETPSRKLTMAEIKKEGL